MTPGVLPPPYMAEISGKQVFKTGSPLAVLSSQFSGCQLRIRSPPSGSRYAGPEKCGLFSTGVEFLFHGDLGLKLPS